jgi:hypothetical protein
LLSDSCRKKAAGKDHGVRQAIGAIAGLRQQLLSDSNTGFPGLKITVSVVRFPLGTMPVSIFKELIAIHIFSPTISPTLQAAKLETSPTLAV